MYKMMKVFDCQRGMPEDVKQAFFDMVSKSSYSQGNDCYVSHEVMLPTYYDNDDEGHEVITECDEYTLVDKWLLESGAFGGEYVLIKNWW